MIPVLVGGVVAIIGGVTTYFWNDIFGDVKKELKGKHIVVLGTSYVGKTTFLNFLETGKITKEYKPTTATEGVKHTRDIFGMKFSYNDMSGTELVKDDWLEMIKKSNKIIYFMNVNKILLGDKQEIDHIRSNIREIEEAIRTKSTNPEEKVRKKGKNTEEKVSKKSKSTNSDVSIVLVANHADEQSGYKREYSQFVKNVANLPIVIESRLKLGGTNKVRLVVGSLVSEEEAKKLLKSIFNPK